MDGLDAAMGDRDPALPTGAAERLRVRVNAVTREAEDIRSFELVAAGGEALPAFTAGAHVDVHIRDGLLRQYSLCNDPRERHRYLIAVLQEADGRGGSLAMHGEVGPGDRLTISAPRNNFPLAGPEANFHLLLAGGIGVTPMMAMVAELEARSAPFRLHYCTRAPEKTAFRARLRPLVEAGKVVLHHDGGDPARGLDIAATLRGFEPGMHCYFCGPAGFMSAARAAVGHWPSHAVHYEYFTAVESDEAPAENRPFEIVIKSSGEVIEVPADQTIVEVLHAKGIYVETSCEEGICATCLTRYLEGEPEHRDSVLDDTERAEWMTICCSRAKSRRLVLDL